MVTAVAGVLGATDPLTGEGGPATSAALNLAADVAVGRNGDIYIADYNSSRVVRIRSGTLSALWRGNFSLGDTDVSGIAVAPDGQVYFTTGRAIRRIAPDGGKSSVVSTAGAVSGTKGSKLAFGPDGALYVATGRFDPRVYRITSDGKLKAVAGTGVLNSGALAGDGGPALDAALGSISDLAIAADGRIYIADLTHGVVRVVDTDGIIGTVVGGGAASPLPSPEPATPLQADELKLAASEIGVALDAAGRLYVTDFAMDLVVRVAVDGSVEVLAGRGNGTKLGQPAAETRFHHPTRLTVAPSGDALVLVEGGNLLWRIAGW